MAAMESVSPGPGAVAEAVESADPPGNQRLTAMTGAVLLVLFAAEVITTLLMGSFFSLHFFLGMVLIGPVSLKVGSTVWRFIRYYTGSKPYVRRGPPPTLERMLGPILILTSLAVLGSGVMLAVTGPGGSWGRIHQLSFYLWLIVVIVHLVVYLPKLPNLLSRAPTERAVRALAASRTRWVLLAASIIGGLILAVLTYHLRARWGNWGGNIL
jgi:hypothetical protein